jgi:hypothetical protein
MMNRQRKKLLICFRFNCIVASLRNQVEGIGLSFSPSASAAKGGDAVDVDVLIEDSENETQKYSFKNLSDFDFNVSYVNAVVDFESHTVKSKSDETDSDHKDRRQLNALGKDMLDMAGFFHLWDFKFRLSDTFPLATVSFLGSGLGKRSLLFSNVRREDEWGNSFSASLR